MKNLKLNASPGEHGLHEISCVAQCLVEFGDVFAACSCKMWSAASAASHLLCHLTNDLSSLQVFCLNKIICYNAHECNFLIYDAGKYANSTYQFRAQSVADTLELLYVDCINLSGDDLESIMRRRRNNKFIYP